MFCPKCNTHLTEPELVRRNTRYLGNVAVEYDARCPSCGAQIGRVSWGRFTVNPELAGGQYDGLPDEPLTPEREGLIPPPPELRPVLRSRKAAPGPAVRAPAPEPDPEAIKMEPGGKEEAPPPPVCPCCGQPWPEGRPFPAQP